MAATRLTDIAADRPVDELSAHGSGCGSRFALAQGTDLMLLDEPTTFLDLAHQVEVLDLLAELNATERRTVVAADDLNLACRYAHHLVAMKDGAIVCHGPPAEVITPATVECSLACDVIADPRPARCWCCRLPLADRRGA